jgi:outer membrane protein assembly factor BamA
MGFWHFAIFLLLPPPAAIAQSSRADEIEKARRRKAANLIEDQVNGVEQALSYIQREKILERITAGVSGFRVKFGGLATGSGFAIGPEYYRRDWAKGNVEFRGSARSSFSAWQLYDLELRVPRLGTNRVALSLLAEHRNFAGLNYYGPGPDSAKTGRSNFRLEDTTYDAALSWRPAGPVRIQGSGGFLQVNVGPGGDRRFVSAEKIYSPQQVAGIDRQTDFLRGAIMAQLDWRDNPAGPRRGGNYVAKLTQFSDRRLGLHDFRRVDFELQQYISFFNGRRVIALRARNTITDTAAGHRVPFYLQPTVGGSDDLRGFRPFRFYDDNAMVLNAEYRWESFTGLDMALFVDAGKVTSGRGRWNLRDLEASAGFGFRFNVNNGVFLRLDFGFSHEGFQAWVKFNNVF